MQTFELLLLFWNSYKHFIEANNGILGAIECINNIISLEIGQSEHKLRALKHSCTMTHGPHISHTPTVHAPALPTSGVRSPVLDAPEHRVVPIKHDSSTSLWFASSNSRP